jgi:hypothetical protein
MMAQHILPILPAGSTPITATLSVLNDAGRWTYFHGLLPVFSHAAGDTASFRMFTGQLAANGHCMSIAVSDGTTFAVRSGHLVGCREVLGGAEAEAARAGAASAAL